LAQFAREGKVNVNAMTLLVLYITIFFILAPILAQIMAKFIQVISRAVKTEDFIPPVVVALVFFFAYLSHAFHVEAILGAFTAGLALSRRFIIPFAVFLRTDEKMAEKVEHTIMPLVWVLTPIFFVFVGLQLNLKEAIDFSDPKFWITSLVISVAAFIGKVIAGFFVSRQLRESLLIGFSMLPRGEVGLIFAEVGRQANVYDDFLYAVVIFVVATTTLVAPIVLKLLAK